MPADIDEMLCTIDSDLHYCEQPANDTWLMEFRNRAAQPQKALFAPRAAVTVYVCGVCGLWFV
jgi:hypothetical protein